MNYVCLFNFKYSQKIFSVFMFYCQNPDYFTDTLSTLFENVTNVDYKVKNSLPSVRFTGRRRRWRTSLLQFLQVLHEEVCSVVV